MTKKGNTKTKKGTLYRFRELENDSVQITDNDSGLDITLIEVHWGMLEDMMAFQETVKDNPQEIFKFFGTYIEGGGRAVPIRHTQSLFKAIAEYLKTAMTDQKN